MKLKAVSGIMLTLLLIGMLILTFNIQPTKAEPTTIIVPDDYAKIQWAIGNASDGDTISVRAGTYYENVVVNKSVSLIGQNMSNTIIDGSAIGTVIHIMADNVTVSGFTIRNSCNRTGIHTDGSGISIGNSSYCKIEQNNITHNDNGISGYGGSFNVFTENLIVRNHLRGIVLGWAGFEVVYSEIKGNTIYHNHYYGIDLFLGRNNLISQNNLSKQKYGLRLLGGCRQNVIEKNIFPENGVSIYLNAYGSLETPSNNLIIENKIEVLVVDPAENNVIYHNNFLESNPVAIYRYGINIWDNGYSSGGNYWSDYTDVDQYSGPYQNETGSDGIWDHPYFIDENNQDNYPLIHLYGSIRNLDTNLTYLTIQSAIDAPETLDGHTILVDAGTYYEHVTIDKTIALVGENPSNTMLDGNGTDIIVLIFAENVCISGFTIQNGLCGICLAGLIGTTKPMMSDISNNIITSNEQGIDAVFSHNNTITDNIIQNNSRGIFLSSCGGTILKHNTMSHNSQNFGVGGYTLLDFTQNVDATNTVDGKPIYYWVNQRDKRIPADAGYVAAVNSLNISVENLSLKNNREGVLFAYTTNSTIENVNVSNCSYGFKLHNSNNNKIVGNVVSNGEEGIRLQSSGNNSIIRNTMINNTGYEYHAAGIHLIYGSSGNVINGNAMSDNYCGIRFTSSNGTIVQHNNFVNNTYQVLGSSYDNVWDDGYPSGGNYWSDYSDTDFFSGPFQNETGSDGIGDTPYVIDENNRDNYPLMKPWSPAIAATIDLDPDTLNLKSKGRWITVYIELPENYNVSEVDRATILLNGTIPVDPFWVDKPLESVIGDYDNDIVPDLMVKFNRAVVIEYLLNQNITYGNVTLAVTEELYDGTSFEGSDMIMAKMPGKAIEKIPREVDSDDEYVPVIPEFPSFLILPLFMAATLLAVIITRRKHKANLRVPA